jgi:hypothetical protein
MRNEPTRVAAITTATTPQQEAELSASFYNSYLLKLRAPAEIRHCEINKAVAK